MGVRRNWSKIDIDWSKTNKELAEELGCNAIHVSMARGRHAPETVRRSGGIADDRRHVNYFLRRDLAEKLRRVAKAEGISMTALVELLIEEGLSEE